MSQAFIQNYSICCSLGCNSDEAFNKIIEGKNGLVKKITGRNQSIETVGAFAPEVVERIEKAFPGKTYSFFEKLCLQVITDALKNTPVAPNATDCLFILSTTKGNISSLTDPETPQQSLFSAAEHITQYFSNQNRPVVVSNACISGVLALILAKDYIDSGKYKTVIVVGCDQLSDFTINGFQSFQALAPAPCRPFDKEREGLNLGEAAACIIVSDTQNSKRSASICISGGGLSNDANHLSGPSRTGEELSEAIRQAIKEVSITVGDIQMIAAHGTATRYNDEMEAKALALAGVNQVSLHSLKSYIGHTLGAAGIIETIFATIAMENNRLIPSLNFEETDVPVALNVCQEAKPLMLRHVLKTASGFGGCNAALVLSKY